MAMFVRSKLLAANRLQDEFSAADVNVRLPQDAIGRFDEEGYLLLPALFCAEEVASLRRALPEILGRDGVEVVREEGDSGAAKMGVGLHFSDEPFRRASLHPRMVGPAEPLTRARAHAFP